MPDTPQGDALDQIAEQQASQQAQSQPQQTPAQPQVQQSAMPQGDALDQVADNFGKGDSSAGGMYDKASSFWSWANAKLDKPLVPQALQEKLKAEDAIGDKIIQHEINSAHPWRAALAQFYYGSMKDDGQLAVSMTTPKQLGLTIASGAESTLVKSGLALANLYFAARGAAAMFEDGRAAYNGDPESAQNVLFGASGVALGTAGAGAD